MFERVDQEMLEALSRLWDRGLVRPHAQRRLEGIWRWRVFGVEMGVEGSCGKQGPTLLVSSEGQEPPRFWQAPL